jgi:hypothetical protein
MSASEQSGLQQSAAEAGGALQGLIRSAAGCTKPVLSDAAQAFLGERGQLGRYMAHRHLVGCVGS